MYLISLDLSISSTGMTIFNSGTNHTEFYIFSSKLNKKEIGFSAEFSNSKIALYNTKSYYNLFNPLRYHKIAQDIVTKLAWIKPEDAVIVVEGASFASKGLLFDIGNFAGLVFGELYNHGFDIQYICPSQEWKKFHNLSKRGLTKINYIYHASQNYPVFNQLTDIFNEKGFNYLRKGAYTEDLCDSFLMGQYYLEKFND